MVAGSQSSGQGDDTDVKSAHFLLSLPVQLDAHGRIRFEHELCASETRTNPLSGMMAIEELPDRVTKLSGMTGRENVELRHRDFLPSDERLNDHR